MTIKIDIIRQSLIIYCGIAFSACLALLSGFMLILHLPLMALNFEYAVYLQLEFYDTLSSCMTCISIDCFIASVGSLVIFSLFINIKARKPLWKFLRPIYLCNCILIFLNITAVFLIIDGIGLLQTDIQFKLHSRMKFYGKNDSNLGHLSYNFHKDIIDKMQQSTKCCGVTGPTDWFNIRWVSLLDLHDLQNLRYLNQLGLVALAPLSCCDRRKTFICPKKDPNPMKRYFTEGCRYQLTENIIYRTLTSEIVLSIILVVLQVILIVIFHLTSSSIKTMLQGIYGENVGIASLTSYIPTRHLELQSRGTPLMVPPTKEKLPHQMKRKTHIEKIKQVGKMINGTPYLRHVKETYPTTRIQAFLKIYFPIVERAIFDEDPSFNVILFRFFAKALIGSQIANLFLTAFSTAIEGQAAVSPTLVDLVYYSTYVSFTFAFIKSTKFRAVAILLIPNLGLKTGRAFLMAELARITAIGPLACIAGNIQAVMLSLHCSIGVAMNITRDIQKVAINPLEKLIVGTIESSDKLKKATLDVYNASRPITDEIDESGNRSKKIRASLQSGSTTREVNLKNRFTKMLHKLDRNEQRKFQQKTQKLRNQYLKLEAQFKKTMITIDKYKDVFSNKSSQISSQIRTKMFSGCASIEQLKSQICQKTIGLACTKMQNLVMGGLNLGFSLKNLCYDEIDSDSSCNIKKSLEKAQKCANEQEAANPKDGFGSIHHGTKNGLSAMKEIFDFNVTWNYDRKKFNIDGDTILHGTATFSFSLSDAVVVLADLIILFFVVLKILLMLVIFRSFTYCKKYLTDIDYDNKYVTKYFQDIDKQRKLMNRTNLLPLKSYERKKVLFKQVFYTSEEISKVIKDLIKVSAIFLSLLITFLVAEVFFTALEIIRDVTMIELTIKTDEVLNITTSGDGFIKHLIDIMLVEIKSLGGFNITYSLVDCAPDIQKVSEHHKRLFTITTIIVYTLTISNGYLVRSRHFICGYFYPKREKQRIVHLYNTLLLGRKRYMRSKKNIIIFKVEQNRLEAEYSFLLSLRRDYPYFFNWLKIFSKYKCLICDDNEQDGFFICQEDFSPFCPDCFEDIGKSCLVCFMMKLKIQQDNLNNYYEAQYPFDSDSKSDFSSSGCDNSDAEKINEVIGWTRHPLEVFKDDIVVYKSLMKQLLQN